LIAKSFCERFIKKYSTAIRVAIAFDLMKRYNMSQFQAAKLVNLPQPLLHYALHKKRNVKGLEELLNDAAALEAIRYFSERAAQGEQLSMCEICMSLRKLVERGTRRYDRCIEARNQ